MTTALFAGAKPLVTIPDEVKPLCTTLLWTCGADGPSLADMAVAGATPLIGADEDGMITSGLVNC